MKKQSLKKHNDENIKYFMDWVFTMDYGGRFYVYYYTGLLMKALNIPCITIAYPEGFYECRNKYDEKLSEKSEKDVLNLLSPIRRELHR